MADTMNSWEVIRNGASDVEHLIGHKQYNMAMVKARQTLEVMVNSLADFYGLETGDLKTTIDDLYRIGVISKTSAEHYHKIRMIGNKAVHEGEDSPTGANVAYHMLSQELYTFANDLSGKKKPLRKTKTASASRNPDDDIRPIRVRKSKKNSRIGEKIFIVVAIILAILLVIGIIKLITSDSDKSSKKENETEMQTVVETAAPVVQPETYPVETEPQTEAVVMGYVINAQTVNIREEPNTNCRILVQLSKGTPINVIEEVDADWVKIDLDGTEAYVNRQFIAEAEAVQDSEESPEMEAE
ncbi:MAG: SH3 domain-containing protein [Lachnospiraceae bacterium]|nr:SH3 domain-containing protein [Lachnospiraceae bacterium]